MKGASRVKRMRHLYLGEQATTQTKVTKDQRLSPRLSPRMTTFSKKKFQDISIGANQNRSAMTQSVVSTAHLMLSTAHLGELPVASMVHCTTLVAGKADVLPDKPDKGVGSTQHLPRQLMHCCDIFWNSIGRGVWYTPRKARVHRALPRPVADRLPQFDDSLPKIRTITSKKWAKISHTQGELPAASVKHSTILTASKPVILSDLPFVMKDSLS